MTFRFFLVTITLLMALSERSQGLSAEKRVVFLVPVEEKLSLGDDLFLQSIPASVAAGSEKPIVCAVDPLAPWRPELLDYLHRYEPDQIIWVGPKPTTPSRGKLKLEIIEADSAEMAAQKIATKFWGRSELAVIYDDRDRAAILSASVLAARLKAPLFPQLNTLGEDLIQLGARTIFVVGDQTIALPKSLKTQQLKTPLAVAKFLSKQKGGVDYLTLIQPLDGEIGTSPRNSLAGALLAAGRKGAIVPFPFNTVWKQEFPAFEITKAPKGSHFSRSGYRRGNLSLESTSTIFTTGEGKGYRKWWAQIDLDGNGEFSKGDEGPFYTGDEVEINAKRYTVNVDVLEKERGKSLWLTSPTPSEIVDHLNTYYAAIGRQPKFLCIVGWPDQIPLANIRSIGQDSEQVSDHPYAQTDEDPFIDLAFSRFVGEDLPSATLLACRGFSFADFKERSWERTYATAHWSKRYKARHELAGFRFIGHHEKEKTIKLKSPLTKAGIILHGEHSSAGHLGKTYGFKQKLLLSPCIVDSRGCRTAMLDNRKEKKSIATRMLRNGAVAYFGNSRRGIGRQELYRSELWNALFSGKTLGEAHRDALNRTLVAILDKGEMTRGGLLYIHDQVAAYGDPALDFRFSLPEDSSRIHCELVGSKVTIRGPSNITKREYLPNTEWGCEFDKLWSWTILGAGTEQNWTHQEKFNLQDLIFTAEIRTDKIFTQAIPINKAPSPLGAVGKVYIDHHVDGTQSYLWRNRLVDFDQRSGNIKDQTSLLEYRMR